MNQADVDRLLAGMPAEAMMTRETADDLEAKWPGVKIPPERIMSPNSEEQVLVICNIKGMPTDFSDNVTAHCIGCGTEVYHRSHVPERAIKACIRCAPVLIEQTREKNNGDVT